MPPCSQMCAERLRKALAGKGGGKQAGHRPRWPAKGMRALEHKRADNARIHNMMSTYAIAGSPQARAVCQRAWRPWSITGTAFPTAASKR